MWPIYVLLKALLTSFELLGKTQKNTKILYPMVMIAEQKISSIQQEGCKKPPSYLTVLWHLAAFAPKIMSLIYFLQARSVDKKPRSFNTKSIFLFYVAPRNSFLV